jgi:hypothetical protein
MARRVSSFGYWSQPSVASRAVVFAACLLALGLITPSVGLAVPATLGCCQVPMGPSSSTCADGLSSETCSSVGGTFIQDGMCVGGTDGICTAPAPTEPVPASSPWGLAVVVVALLGLAAVRLRRAHR